MANSEPRWSPSWPSWSQDGTRERQDGAKMAKSEPKWSQHGSKMPKIRQNGPTLCLSRKSFIFLWFLLILEAQREPQVAQERAKVGPRRPSWSQDGSKMAQETAKMAKLEPRGSQHGSKMAQDAPRWSQESAKMEPRWPSRSQNGANMAPRCQRCVNMGRHCAYLEKASFSFGFSWF